MKKKVDIQQLNAELKKLSSENRELKNKIEHLEKITSTESPYKILAERSKDGILIIHGETVKYVNNGFLELTGFTKEEVLEFPYSKFTPPDEFKKLKDNSVRRMAGEGIPSIYETIIIGKNNTLIDIEINVTIDNYLGKPAFIVAIRDISQFEKVKKEKADQAIFLATLLDALPIPVFYKNSNKIYIGCNKAFCELTGISADKFIGNTAFDVFSKGNAGIYNDQDDKILTSGKQNVIETKMSLSKGTKKEIILYKQAYYDDNNNPAGIIGAVLDITESNKIKAELENKQKYMESIVQNLPLLVFVIDSGNKFNFVEGKILKMLNLDPANLIGNNYLDALKDEPVIIRSIEKALKGEINYSFDVFRRHHFETHYVKLRDSKMETGLLGVTLDITDRRNAELEIQKYLLELEETKDKLQEYSLELEESQKDLIALNESKDKFFSIISHDLRSPFTSLIGLSDFIVQEFETITKEELKDAVYSFNRNSKNILSFLENLLSWARIQMNRQEMVLTSVNLSEMILGVLEIFKLNIKNKQIVIKNSTSKKINIFADENMISTAIRNIVSNSVKFTPDGGFLSFEVTCDDDFCFLQISDSGIGIPKERLETLFEIDSIKSSPGLKGEKGTGLGLILTKDLIEANGGNIEVVSTENAGTTFKIKLPVLKPA